VASSAVAARSFALAGGVSVLVCTRNRSQSLVRTVRSLLATEAADYEVIVVDQSEPSAASGLADLISDSRLRHVPTTSRGKGAALNEGLRLARSAIVVCTDDDCEAEPGWAARMTRALEGQPTAAVAFCNVTAAPCDWECGYVPTYVRTTSRLIRTLIGTCGGHGMGAGMAVRREIILAIGGFDETVGPGGRFPSGDDWDIEHRVLLNGWHVYEAADISIVHYGFRTWAEGRAHVYRDWFAIGGVCAKPVRVGNLSAAVMALWYLATYGAWPMLWDALRLKRPRGFARFVGFAAGFARGIRTRVDRKTLLFRKLEHTGSVAPNP
jgi:glycosyltransferase involved in cell wall biosynthesis